MAGQGDAGVWRRTSRWSLLRPGPARRAHPWHARERKAGRLGEGPCGRLGETSFRAPLASWKQVFASRVPGRASRRRRLARSSAAAAQSTMAQGLGPAVEGAAAVRFEAAPHHGPAVLCQDPLAPGVGASFQPGEAPLRPRHSSLGPAAPHRLSGRSDVHAIDAHRRPRRHGTAHARSARTPPCPRMVVCPRHRR